MERRMRRSIVLAAALLATGCSSQLSSDLRAAGAPCEDRQWPNKAALAACLDSRERPVWARDEPSTLELYDAFARQRDALARQYDQGSLTDEQYRAKLDRTATEFKARIANRRKAAAGAR